MTTFSISLPEDEQKALDEEAKRNDRSRAAQVRVILRDWFGQNSKRGEKQE